MSIISDASSVATIVFYIFFFLSITFKPVKKWLLRVLILDTLRDFLADGDQTIKEIRSLYYLLKIALEHKDVMKKEEFHVIEKDD
ncbi:transmembrane domain protein [Sulfolobus ellipsoid virus 1]|uniref:Transmembrane domain protein n=1 Tax=Sulfolobus ellipsoid virus 1 TaxID=2056194 RepID=A0A2H4RBR0_9VIRU|nr:transmembrane domain protein [Sulfolobus ellipsoid virus 1]ATY46504.1 transmembrane domain protein [Sulfolobus ellipsoid virus 1]